MPAAPASQQGQAGGKTAGAAARAWRSTSQAMSGRPSMDNGM